MELENVLADIQPINVFIREVNIHNLDGILPPENQQTYSLAVEHSEIQTVDGKKQQGLRLSIECKIVGIAENVVKLILEGYFESKDEKIDEKDFIELVKYNGTAALYSIARAKIEELTSLVFSSGKIIIPMINIIKFFDKVD